MSDKQALVPRLRFPEFQEAGEWELRKLGDKDVSEFARKKVALNQITVDTYVSTENISPDFDGITAASKLPPSGSFTAYKKGDILIANIRPYLKKVWAANRSGGASNDVVVVRPKNRNKNPLLPFLLKNEVFIDYVMRGAKGVKMPRGDVALMKKYPLALPDPEEQQKIAACLSSLDALIAAQAQKIDALKAHKKGLMQQLFPGAGESVPRLRFPEFQDAGEWDEKKLVEIAEFYKGKGISKANIKLDGSQPCIRYGELYTVYGELIDDVISKTDLSPSELFFSNTGDVIIPSSGETKIDIATAACVVRKDIALGSDLNVIRSKQNGIFLSYYLNGVLRYEIAKVAQGDTVVHLYKSNLEKLGLAIPPLKEQQKIAACLSSLDALISTQKEQIDTLKTHKKGLMQQLFPALEATG